MRLSLLQKQESAHDDSVWAAAWAPTGNTLVTGSVDESVKLWQEVGDTLEQQHHLVSAIGAAGRAGAWGEWQWRPPTLWSAVASLSPACHPPSF